MSVYNSFFGFGEAPFNQTPDTSLFFPSEKHKAALDALLYSVHDRKGFALVTGEIGCGKTTVVRTLLKKISGKVRCALINNTRLSPKGVLTLILEELEVPYRPGSKETLILQLNHYLIRQAREGINVVFMIDEAQNLSQVCLEELRLLSNLETEKEKLVQMILVGQPELRKKIQMPELQQLRQRIRVFYHLEPLDELQTRNYIAHRLQKVRKEISLETDPFTSAAVQAIYEISGGVPRVINMICDHSLLMGFVAENKILSVPMIAEAARELNLRSFETFEQIYQSA